MTTFVRCYLQEEGLLVLGSLSLLVLVAILLGLVLSLFGVISVWRARHGRDARFEIRLPGGRVVASGAVAAFVVVVAGVALVAAPFLLTWYAYDRFAAEYAVDLDTPTIEKSLDEIRLGFHQDTRVPVTLSDEAKTFKVTGHFGGMCVSDLFDSICRKYDEQLSCNMSWLDGITVNSR